MSNKRNIELQAKGYLREIKHFNGNITYELTTNSNKKSNRSDMEFLNVEPLFTHDQLYEKACKQQMFDLANMIFENNRQEAVKWAKNLIFEFSKDGFELSVDIKRMQQEIDSLRASKQDSGNTKGIITLKHVIEQLRETGQFNDDEGELTNELEVLLKAITN